MGLIDKASRRMSPMRGVMTGRDYRAVGRRGHFEGGSTRLFGRRLRYSSAGGLLHSVREIFREEVYRFDAANGRAPRIVDAGANIGLSVLYFKRRHPDATIVAYEPDPDIFAMLKANVGDLPGVELREAAAWVEDATLAFHAEGSLAGSLELDAEKRGRRIEVRAERLKTELAKAHVDFLKIDIEGAENSVLFDIADELANVDLLFFEYHGDPAKPQRLGDLLNLVSRAGFRYALGGAHGSAHPFTDPPPHAFDVQLNVSCFRPESRRG